MGEKNENNWDLAEVMPSSHLTVWGLGNVVNNFAQQGINDYYILAHYLVIYFYSIFINDWTTVRRLKIVKGQ